MDKEKRHNEEKRECCSDFGIFHFENFVEDKFKILAQLPCFRASVSYEWSKCLVLGLSLETTASADAYYS